MGIPVPKIDYDRYRTRHRVRCLRHSFGSTASGLRIHLGNGVAMQCSRLAFVAPAIAAEAEPYLRCGG
jgi:hypothetical protein